jgi:hypothetical protein
LEGEDTKGMIDPVIEWENIIHKKKSEQKISELCKVVAIDEDSIIITTQGGLKEYLVPKRHVETYNGSEVILDFPNGMLSVFEF